MSSATAEVDATNPTWIRMRKRRAIRRSVVIAATMMTVAAIVVGAQAQRPCIALRIQPPGGEPRESDTREGKATVTVQLKHGESYRDFYIDLEIVAADLVHASIRDTRQPDSRVLDELDLPVGEEMTRTSTVPSFGLSIVATYEPTRYGTGYFCHGR